MFWFDIDVPIIIISLLMSPMLGHRPSLWIIHKENIRAITHHASPVWIGMVWLVGSHRLSINRPTKRAKEKYPSDEHCQCQKEMDDNLLAC
jgi:hypothetical protein